MRYSVLGIDPGVASTGWGIILSDEGDLSHVAHGLIKTTPQKCHEERLDQIYTEIKEVIEEFQPDSAAVEKLFFCKNIKTAMGVGEARGVVLLALYQEGLAFREFTPLEIKDAVCGYGNASKRQVQEMVKNILFMEEIPKPDDAADGLAVAICSSSVSNIESKIESAT